MVMGGVQLPSSTKRRKEMTTPARQIADLLQKEMAKEGDYRPLHKIDLADLRRDAEWAAQALDLKYSAINEFMEEYA